MHSDSIINQLQQAVSFHQQGRLEQAEQLYKAILHIQPEQADALHLLGFIAYQRGQAQIAVDLISHAIKINPNNAASYSNRGLALQALNRFDEALISYDHALHIKPDYAEALSNRGIVLKNLQRYDDALASYDRALSIKPDYVDALSNRGNVLKDLKRYDEALASYDRALSIKPDYVEALSNRGNMLKDIKRYDDALASYDRVLSIKPDYVEVLSNRGNVLKDLRRYDEALASYDRALNINPDYVDVLCNRGNVLHKLQRYDEAFASYTHALHSKPNFTEVFFNRGTMLSDLKCYTEALADYDRVLNSKPDFEFLFGYWLYIKMKLCDWREFNTNLEKLTQSVDCGERVSPPFSVLAVFSSAALQKKVACAYVQAKYPSNTLLPPITKYTHSKIRIGYFSADFHNHATAYLMAELFALHDRSRFEVIAFSFDSPRYKDDMRLRLESVFDQFIDVSQQSDEQAVTLARQLEIDIAVDLNGFTDGCRTSLFAMRVAPVQVNYLAYPCTMGADYMDYLLADWVLIPTEYQVYYSEKIAYLPNSYQVNDSHRLSTDKDFTRAECGLPEHGFVFCCFNNNYKITPIIFDSWMRVLHHVEGSVLWLLEDNATATKNLRQEATVRGIDATRLVFAQRLALPEHLARHRLADLFLDTLPCNAHTTASDALWAGLPVLTCIGETFASRVAASLLKAIGLPELITTTLKDYEALAVQLAHHPEQLTAIKHTLADNRLNYPLFNTQLFTQHIESAYQIMFNRSQVGLAPAHIYVSA